MTFKQKFLRAVYPAFMWVTKKTVNGASSTADKLVIAPVSFYSLKETANNGDGFDFAQLKGKKVLLVNTASDCGYTGQYEALEKLYQDNKDKMVVIGFPANDFKKQENGTDAAIATFCKLNYGITFPLMKKSVVIKNALQNNVFKWLTDSAANGWNSQAPIWNFSKYLVNEQGQLTHYFAPAVSPADAQVLKAIAE